MANITDYRFAKYERLASQKLNDILEQINAHNHGSAGGVQLDLTQGTGAIGEGHITGYHIADGAISGRHIAEGTITGRVMLWHVSEGIDVAETPGDPAIEVGARIYVPFGGTFNKVRAYLKTVPQGSNVIIDLNKNGSSVLGPSKLVVLDGENYADSQVFSDASFNAGDYFTMDIDQVGSGEPGEDLTFSVEITTG